MAWRGRDERVEDLFFVDPQSPGAPDEEGQVRVYNDDIVAFIDGEAKSLTAGAGGGITENEHRILRQLIHFIDDGPAEGFVSGAYKETTGTVFPTALVWYTDSGKTDKIVERLLTWAGANVTTDKWKSYDTDGSTVLWTISDAISYSGVFETSRTRTITAGDA